MSGISLKTVEIADSVLYQCIDNEVVLLNMSDQRYFGLDDVGARMWQLMIEQHDMNKVAEHLQTEFDVEPAVLKRDLEHLAQELLQLGLLKSGCEGDSDNLMTRSTIPILR
jgi:hypothetical protein